MFAIEVETSFCAAHALRLPGGVLEPLHGHNFNVTIRIECAQLDTIETVTDFHPVEAALAKIIGPWSNRNLNEIEPFRTSVNPTAERIAEQIGKQMQRALEALLPAADTQARHVHLAEVRLTEAANCLAIWMP